MRRRQLAAGTLASALAFAALLISPVSMARSFGALVAIGLIVSFVLALTAGAAVIGGRAALARRIAPIGRRAAPIGARFARMAGAGVAAPADRARACGLGAGGRRRLRDRARSRATRSAAFARALSAIPRAIGWILGAIAGAVAGLPALAVRIGRAAWGTAHARPGRVLRVALVVVRRRVGGGNPDRRHVGPGPPAADGPRRGARPGLDRARDRHPRRRERDRALGAPARSGGRALDVLLPAAGPAAERVPEPGGPVERPTCARRCR